MEKYNFKKYFDKDYAKYYEPRIIITILEDILGENISVIKKQLSELKIVISTEEIIEYLDNKFNEEEPDVKARLENYKKSSNGYIVLKGLTDEKVKESAQRFVDEITAQKYAFDSYTLDYFNTYSNIVRNKASKILDIIEKIVNRDYSTIANLMIELDIALDENGNITKDDIIRLIPPFIHNYNLLIEKVNAANDLETYLTFKLSKHSILKNGGHESELYPSLSIQTDSLYRDYLPGYIPLSNKQKEGLKQQEKEYTKKFVNQVFFGLDE